MTLAPTVRLLHGAEMPALGLGTSPMDDADTERAVAEALAAGYRLIDTAENYGNERGVGDGIRASGVVRDEVFVTTKFNKRWHSVEGARQAFEASCQRLGVDYIDLLLIHWPNPDQDRYVQAVEGLAALLEAGSVRAIGSSNFKPAHLQRVIEATGIVVDVNQIQLSPYTTRESTRAFDAEHGIVTESWSPIGGSNDDLRSDPVITAIAERHGKTPTQVVLRWHVQLGLVTIPKSGHPGRIAENIDIFDFELDADEMASINALDQGEAAATDSDTTGH
ncbi:MAG: 2,5-diketo-D-gluconate reductase [Propionibacteriaceae bacterium]|nr:2,5-diketo-D-gluconate reductase [Propionibacteriaceae bacterium]